MCVCDPSKRTPYCGGPGCERPEQIKSEKMKKFNLNDVVRVKITRIGLIHMKKKYEQNMGIMLNTYPYQEPKVDSEGYTEMQMHAVMYVFGDICCNGFDVPIEPNILIEERFLE